MAQGNIAITIFFHTLARVTERWIKNVKVWIIPPFVTPTLSDKLVNDLCFLLLAAGEDTDLETAPEAVASENHIVFLRFAVCDLYI